MRITDVSQYTHFVHNSTTVDIVVTTVIAYAGWFKTPNKTGD